MVVEVDGVDVVDGVELVVVTDGVLLLVVDELDVEALASAAPPPAIAPAATNTASVRENLLFIPLTSFLGRDQRSWLCVRAT